MNFQSIKTGFFGLGIGLVFLSNPAIATSEDIVHDSEYYILKSQNAEKWAKDDQIVDEKVAAFRSVNGGKAPNIVYILVDDIGFGDMGIPELNAIRGYKTPNINTLSDQPNNGPVRKEVERLPGLVLN